MYHYIYGKANELERKFGSRNIYEIIKQSDLHLMKFQNLGKLKGFYTLCLKQYYVGLNDKLPEREQEMVVAHELGHHILHRPLAGKTILNDVDFYNTKSQTEYEANIFAAEFLVTDKQIELLVDESRDYMEMSAILGYDKRLIIFKLNNMIRRGYNYNLPNPPDSLFLGK